MEKMRHSKLTNFKKKIIVKISEAGQEFVNNEIEDSIAGKKIFLKLNRIFKSKIY